MKKSWWIPLWALGLLFILAAGVISAYLFTDTVNASLIVQLKGLDVSAGFPQSRAADIFNKNPRLLALDYSLKGVDYTISGTGPSALPAVVTNQAYQPPRPGDNTVIRVLSVITGSGLPVRAWFNDLPWYQSSPLFLSAFILLLVVLLYSALFFTMAAYRRGRLLAQADEWVGAGRCTGESDSLGVLFERISEDERALDDNARRIRSLERDLDRYLKSGKGRTVNVPKDLLRMTERIQTELEMARRVQQGILPHTEDYPFRNEIQVGSKYLSMESLGGDLYDIIRIGKNGYGFLMADVSGHGVPAALITTMAKVVFHDNSGWNISTQEVCERVNRDFYRLIGDLGYYITAYYAKINLETGILEYTSAGHHPAILFHKDGSWQKLATSGSIIGIFESPRYTSGQVELKAGDRLLLYTDGIIETRNDSDEYFGMDRLVQYVHDSLSLSPDRVVDGLIEAVEAFSGGRPPDDDRALLCVEFLSVMKPAMSVTESIRIAGETAHVRGHNE